MSETSAAPATPDRSSGWRPALLIGLLVAGLYAGFVLLAPSPTWFIKFGETGKETELGRAILGPDLATPFDESQDGTRFWLLARDPTLADAPFLNAQLDNPTYRAQRILYPALVAPWRLGGEQAVVWGLVLTNVAAVFVGTVLTARLAQALGTRARFGYLFALNPVVLVGFVLDLSDVLAAACVVGMVLAVRKERWLWAVFAAALAVLAKENSLLAAVGVALFLPLDPRRLGLPLVRLQRLALVAVPAAVGLGWAIVSRLRLGVPATSSSVEAFTLVPFSAFVDSFRYGWSVTGYNDMVTAILVVVVAVAVVVRFWRRRTIELAASLGFVVLLPFYSALVVYRGINSVRTLGPAITLLAVDYFAERVKVRRPLRPPRPVT